MRIRALVGVVVGAVATILLADACLTYFVPPGGPREVTEGIQDLAASNPTTLVIGSSHARTFHALALELRERLGTSSLPMVAIPLENGKLLPYRWLLENRVAPLIDEVAADGTRVRPNLENLVLVTEWWDSCDKSDGVYWNLPSRAWTLRDYVRDVSRNGVTSYNRNYVQTVIRRSFPHSALVVDRTVPRVKAVLGRRLLGIPFPRTPEEEEKFLEGWRVMVEEGVRCIGAPAQMTALEQIIDFAKARNLHMTLVLFPRKPATLSERAKATTLEKFQGLLQAVAARRAVTLVDLTTSTPLTDEDFMADFDHVNAAGNQKFARWALEHHFQFLLKPGVPTDELSPRVRVTP